jgi:coproporphyrinogen III oxidase-like Fe-S oxidoreductase
MPPEVALYAHIPWCSERCSFCYYRRSDARSRVEMEQYVRALQQHASHVAEWTQGKAVGSLYFGGGTPALLPPDLLGSTIDARVKQRELNVGKCGERAEGEAAANPRITGSHDALHRIAMDELAVVGVW